MADCITALLAHARAMRNVALALGCYDRTDARDAEPHPMCQVGRGPWCADYGIAQPRHPHDPVYLETLRQLGMRIDENGRYWVTRPPACEHRAHERNGCRWQLGCDGCRRSHAIS
jgi:hypothetical protein